MGLPKITATFLFNEREYRSRVIDDLAEDLLKKLNKNIPKADEIIEIPIMIPTSENGFLTSKIVVKGGKEYYVESI